MSLGKKQEKFAKMVTLLFIHIHASGYGIRIKHAMRCGDCKIGHKNSLHKYCLAIDLALTKDNIYLRKTEDYSFAGEYWKTIGGTWGGDFGDGNHFSLPHNGMK